MPDTQLNPAAEASPSTVAGTAHYNPVAVYTCNNKGYIVYYNHAAALLWQREPQLGIDKWTGAAKTFTPNGTLLPAEDGPMARTLAGAKIADGEELIIARPDGSSRNILAYPVAFYDAEGNIAGASNTLIDITEQKQTETRQAMLAAIIESSEDAIISKTLDGIITSWNNAAKNLFGYAEDEIIGKHITTLIPLERLDEENVIINKIRNNQNVAHFETIRVAKDGSEIQLSLSVSPIRNIAGQVIGASKIARDISSQKAAEARLQQYAERLEILNSVGKMISESLDVKNILDKVTEATTQLTGAAFGAFFYNEVNLKGESYMLYALSGAPREAFEGLGMPRNTAVFHSTFSGEKIVRVDDITKDPAYGKSAPHYGMPQGHLPVVSYLAVPVVSSSGDVIGGLFFGHPQPAMFTGEHEKLAAGVAAQAAIALDNAKLYEEIQMLNAKKDEFIGLASHELKTPITSISGYLQLIERNMSEGDRNKAFISKAMQQVNKLSTLIGDLLDVSKIQTGKLPFSYTGFDMSAMLHDVTEMLQQTYPSHQIELHTPDKLPVTADQQRIEQVIINLISNAVKYSPGANRIMIRAEDLGKKVRISVEDFGIGIEKEQYERIFSRFYRVENLAAHMSGLGIGLYICNEIIDRHHGRLWVESEINKGSTFAFEIPVNGGE
ncbi:MAG: PAS domain S-box protein [Sphingobacteriaceae bacterium]|nr:MAG: PAS domain S-box protein [Sphingobacteriaceae bacterium]